MTTRKRRSPDPLLPPTTCVASTLAAPTLEQARASIDGIDLQIQRLIAERARWARQVGKAKGPLKAALEYYRPEREALARALRERGYFVHPSQTNFLLVEFGANAAAIESSLVARGVVLRPLAGYGLPNCLRIPVGTGVENRRLLDLLDELGAGGIAP